MDRSNSRHAGSIAMTALVTLLACAPRQTAEPNLALAPAPTSPKAASTVTTDRLIVTPTEVADVRELLERGRRYLNEGRTADALAAFTQVARHDADGTWGQAALFEIARAHEESGDHRRAADAFEQVARRYPRRQYAREALLRSIRLVIYLEDWQRGGELAQLYHERHATLAAREALVVYAARALASLHEAQTSGVDAALDAAEVHIAHGRRIIERHRLDSAGIIPRDLAQLYFALGELRRLRGERIRFDPLPADFADVFERRAQLLLDAQRAYSDTMRAHDARWTAMAGYRVGELYQRLYEDVMSAPRPPGANTERRRRLFEAAVRLRYSVLLRKGLNMMEHTLRMAERTGERSSWVARAQAARSELQRALEREQAAIDASNFSRAELERVLQRIPTS